MKIVGTFEGESKFPDCEYMKVNPDNKPKFNLLELLDKNLCL